MKENSAKQRAYEKIRKDILQLTLVPGEPLYEEQLAKSLGVSRTPIREALLLLSKENLVNIVPDRGAFVANITTRQIIEIYQVRQALESLAARLVASMQKTPDEVHMFLKKLDDAPAVIKRGDYHAYGALTQEIADFIVQSAGNQLLRQLVQNLTEQVGRVGVIGSADRLLKSVEEHKAILNAILQHDLDASSARVSEHLERGLAAIFMGRGSAL